jgi:ferredoxin
VADQTPEERMARAEALATEHELPRACAECDAPADHCPECGLPDERRPDVLRYRATATEVTAVLRGLVADLREALMRCTKLEHAVVDETAKARPNWSHAEALQQRDAMISTGIVLMGKIRRLSEENERLTAELATLRASVVAALSGAGPEVGEDDRAG